MLVLFLAAFELRAGLQIGVSLTPRHTLMHTRQLHNI